MKLEQEKSFIIVLPTLPSNKLTAYNFTLCDVN